MNRQKAVSILLTFSLAFNIAFVCIWLYHMLYVRPQIARAGQQALQGREPQEALAPWRLEKLRLTPEQHGRILNLRHGVRPAIVRGVSNVGTAREQFLMLLQDPGADPQRLRAAEQRMAAEQEKLRHQVIEHLIQVREVLDEQQRHELARMLRGAVRLRLEPGAGMKGPPAERKPAPDRKGF